MPSAGQLKSSEQFPKRPVSRPEAPNESVRKPTDLPRLLWAVRLNCRFINSNLQMLKNVILKKPIACVPRPLNCPGG